MRLKNYFFTALTTCIVGTSIAQTTIVERDGSQGEFDPNDWTITNDPQFSTSAYISIPSGETGTLAISNVTSYTQISLEIWLDQGGTVAYTFNTSISDGTNTLSNTGGPVYTSTGSPKEATYNFNNSSPLAVSSFVFENLHASNTVKISYLRLYGTPAGGSSSVQENETVAKVSTVQNMIAVEASFNGQVEVFNIAGQQLKKLQVQPGVNYYNESMEAGIYFVKLADSEGKVVKTEKIYIR